MGKTRRGVYYNLEKSEYTVTNGEVFLFFSSEFRMNKFLDEYEERRKTFTHRFEKAMKIEAFNIDGIADVQSYTTIETNGFFALHKGMKIDEEAFIKYGGSKIMQNESCKWWHEPCSRMKERLKSLND